MIVASCYSQPYDSRKDIIGGSAMIRQRWFRSLHLAMGLLLVMATLLTAPGTVMAWSGRDATAPAVPGSPAPLPAGSGSRAPLPERYPVILLPGIAGSELYNGTELVWINVMRLIGRQLPIFSFLNMGWLLPLRLAEDGLSPYSANYRVRVGDVLRHGVTDGYSGLIRALRTQGYVEGDDLRLMPYDWRKEPGLAAEQLGQLVDRTLAETGASQVVLIGHSLGGLIARDYVVRGGAPKVKATIALATPWFGVPVAYRALAYGWDFGIRIPGTGWSALAPADVKRLAQNFPSVYALAPGKAWFDWQPEGYLSRDGRQFPFKQSLEEGLGAHNRALALRAPAYQERLLDGRDHGVMQFVFAGTGRRTIIGLDEQRSSSGALRMTERYGDGDEMVPLVSADLGYHLDEKRAERYIGKVVSVAYVNQPHILFAQSPAVHDVVLAWLDVIHGRRPPGFEQAGW